MIILLLAGVIIVMVLLAFFIELQRKGELTRDLKELTRDQFINKHKALNGAEQAAKFYDMFKPETTKQ